MKILPFAAALAACALPACSDDGGDGDPGSAPGRGFRAIAGVSMGAYGAMNLGTKRPDLFGVIGSLGGPVDMTELLRHIALDNLEVKAQAGVPREVGEDFTFDHLPPYPARETRLTMVKDLVLALGNPFLHHPDPSRRYLASDSQPAATARDDALGTFTVIGGRGFLDGGDANDDGLRQLDESADFPTDVLLLAAGSIGLLAPGGSPVLLGSRALRDLDGDGVFDVGDGVVVNLSEPFTDSNGNLTFEPAAGETFTDAGLDGVPGTGDLGEGNGRFDEDPDRASWLEEDPLTRLAARPAGEILEQRIYMDAGTEDQFGFARHYANLVAVLRGKGIEVEELDDLPGSCASLPDIDAPFVLARYAGEHIGIPDDDTITDDLLAGDFCGPAVVWRRLLALLGFLDSSFPGGMYGAGGTRLTGDMTAETVPSPALAPAGGASPGRTVLVYRPPAHFNTGDRFPVAYILGGYGQDPADFERADLLLDLLISAGQLQNMYVAFLPGAGGVKGSFYLNHRVPADQAQGAVPTSGRYEDSIVEDLIPFIEETVLEGRVRG